MPAGWVYEPFISFYEALLLYNVFKKRSDSFYYKPIAIARREEIGMKYRFLCIAYPKELSSQSSHFVEIEIYKPSKGMPYATGLYHINDDKMFPHRLPII